MKLRFVFGALAALAVSTTSFGQGSITNGNAVYTHLAGNTGSSDFLANGAGVTDQTTGNQWLFRLAGATGQMRLSMGTATSTATGGALGVTSQSYVGNLAMLDWTSGGLLFHLNITLNDGVGTESADLLQSMVVTNTNNFDTTLEMFHYADIDLSRALAAAALPPATTAFGNDSATINGAGTMMTITDGAYPSTMTWSAPTANAWEIRAFSSLGTALRSATTYNLANVGSPFGPADFTGAFQWNLALAAGQSVTLASNMSLTSIPTPGALALFGLAGLMGSRRRRA